MTQMANAFTGLCGKALELNIHIVDMNTKPKPEVESNYIAKNIWNMTCLLIYMAMPFEKNVLTKEYDKLAKYKRPWN